MLQVVFSVERKACHRAQLWQSACIVCEANGQQRAAAGAASSGGVPTPPTYAALSSKGTQSSNSCRRKARPTRLSHAFKKTGSGQLGPLVFVVNSIISSYCM